MNDVRLDNLDEAFKHHPPTPEQIERYARIRAAAKTFAGVLLENCPSSADRSTALRKVREAMMDANASIATEHVV
jgi:hypothetical protein